MKNEFLDYEVGTVLKELYMDGDESYYIVGSHFVYANNYEFPEIHPWKFDASCCYVATQEEKEAFLKDLEKNNLIWNKETGKVERKIQDREEQIINAAKKAEKETSFHPIVAIAKGVNSAYGIGFLEGAKWADEHPRKGLVDIDKACKYWTTIALNEEEGEIGYYLLSHIEDFKKVMKE